MNADWFLEYVEVEDRKSGRLWFFPCLKWLGSGADGGQLSRDLYPVDPALKGKHRREMEGAIGLEQKGALHSTYLVVVVQAVVPPNY